MRRQRKARGFTLIEMLIVIIVIAVLAAVVVPKVVNVVGQSKTNASAMQVRILNDALVRVQGDAGVCPADATKASSWLSSITKPSDWPATAPWNGPYINQDSAPTTKPDGSALTFDSVKCRYS